MPNTKITDLTAGNPAQSGDEIPVNRSGTDRKITAGSIAALATAYTDEEAQDAVGTILTDTATIDFTYTDAAPTIEAAVKTDSIDNTLLANMSEARVKGRAVGAGAGDPTDLTGAQVLAIIEATTALLTEAEAAAAYQPLDADLTSWAGVTRASGFDTFAATPTSANLDTLVTDDTGSGALVFGTSPTFTTSILVADETVDIGTSTVGINDLHFGSGGIINFDGGDVTLTHAAETLHLGGGDLSMDDGEAIIWGSSASFNYSSGSSRINFATTGADSIRFSTNNTARWHIDGSGGHLLPQADATYDIGTSTVGINDLHLGAAGVINFDGGDVTLTHSANLLAMAGGGLNIGHTAQVSGEFVSPNFQIHGDALTAVMGVYAWDEDNGEAAHIKLFKSGHATKGSHTALEDGEQMGVVSFEGSDGTVFRVGAEFGGYVDGSPSSDNMPTELRFATGSGGGIGNLATRWRVRAAGHFVPGTDATYDIGTSSVGINDLHLGSGGIINFDGGDVTVTHSANTLTITGGITALDNLSTINGKVLNLTDNNLDELLMWDDSAAQWKNATLAIIATEAAPAAGDFVLIYGAEGDLRKVNWSGLPGGGSVSWPQDVADGTLFRSTETGTPITIAHESVASAVNHLTIRNAATGASPELVGAGTDADVGIEITPKGAATTLVINPNSNGDAGFYLTNGTNNAQMSYGTNLSFVVESGSYSFGTEGASEVTVKTAEEDRWNWDANGHYVPETDATYDIGTTSVAIRNMFSEGYHEFVEISDPAAGAANTGRLFVRDNGGGKSQLCIIFASGAIQVIATEP